MVQLPFSTETNPLNHHPPQTVQQRSSQLVGQGLNSKLTVANESRQTERCFRCLTCGDVADGTE